MRDMLARILYIQEAGQVLEILICLTVGYAVYGHPGIGHPGISAEIVGGQNSDKNEYPWQVMIKYSGGFRCGGSIVSQATILTSANCVNFDSAQRYSFNSNHLHMRQETVQL